VPSLFLIILWYLKDFLGWRPGSSGRAFAKQALCPEYCPCPPKRKTS
jgi:hypothetical protein